MAGRLLDTELKEFDATSLNGTYQDFGSATSNPVTKVMLINTSDVDAYVSEDATTNKFRVPAGAAMTFDEATHRIPNKGQEYYLAKGIQLTIKQVSGAGSDGDIIAHLVTRVL